MRTRIIVMLFALGSIFCGGSFFSYFDPLAGQNERALLASICITAFGVLLLVVALYETYKIHARKRKLAGAV